MLALGSYSSVMQVSEIFVGLWLFPLGWLVYRAGFLPRWLGLLIMGAKDQPITP